MILSAHIGCASPHGAISQPSTEFLTQREAAAHLRLSERTLERYRVAGTGPSFVKFGRRVVYRQDDLRRWADTHTYRSTSEFAVRT